MSSWSEGYVSDINYTYGYYSELNTQQLDIPLLAAGIVPPKIVHACELGFGQGLSLAVHGTAGQAKWYGTDFNPSQALFARHLSEVSGSGRIEAYDESFQSFCTRDDLPEFDFIGLHGIWSWISDENRRMIVDFVRRKLKVGGILYISYNTLPGWAAASPMRFLLAENNRMNGTLSASRHDNTKAALEQTQQILNLSRRLCQQVPELPERTRKLGEANFNYLAHEYLNGDWQPMYYAEMERHLEAAKLTFACSARFLDDFQDAIFDAEQKAYYQSINNPSFAQTAKDFMLNRQFRADYWVKGKRTLSQAEKLSLWDKINIMLRVPRDKVNLTLQHYQTTNLYPDIFNPILDILADGKPHQIGKLRQSLAEKINDDVLHTALSLLWGKGDIVQVQDKAIVQQNRPFCDALNRHILERTALDADIFYLASPMTGGAIACGRIDQLFVLASIRGLKEDKWVEFAWDVLKRQNQVLVHEGEKLEGDEANLAELKRLKDLFVAQEWIMLQNLGVVPSKGK